MSRNAPDGTPAYDKVMARSIWRNGCLIFTGALDPAGYGRIGLPGTKQGRSTLAHRVVMAHHFGPSKQMVLHSCDTPSCVNVDHLRYGKQADNIADAISRGHLPGRSLSDEEVNAIRTDSRQQRLIAADYGIHQCHVSRIKNGRRRS